MCLFELVLLTAIASADGQPPAAPAPAPESLAVARPQSSSRFMLSADALLGVRDLPTPSPAYGFSTGVWMNLGPAVIHPRLGAHLATGRGASHFLSLVADVGGAWAILDGPITPLVGAGVGFRFASVRGPTQVHTTGSVVALETRTAEHRLAVGVGGYARAGVLLFRDAPVSLSLYVDANIASLGDLGTPVGALASLGVQF